MNTLYEHTIPEDITNALRALSTACARSGRVLVAARISAPDPRLPLKAGGTGVFRALSISSAWGPCMLEIGL